MITHQKQKYLILYDSSLLQIFHKYSQLLQIYYSLSPHILQYLKLSQFKQIMIRRQGEYYICQEDEPQPQLTIQPEIADKEYQSVGNIKERLNLIMQRINFLKQEKKSKQSQPQFKISNAYPETSPQVNDYFINLSIPNELLSLEQRIQKIEQKISPPQIQRQSIDKNGNIVERVRKLQKKLQQMIKNKSIEIINQNINQYSTNLDEKEENFKQLYLYQIFSRTQGLTMEIQVLQKYLQNLGKVQRAVSSFLPLPTLISTHNEILKKKEDMSLRIGKMFDSMKKQYGTLLAEIDSIDI